MVVTLAALRRGLRGSRFVVRPWLCAGPNQQMEDSIMSLKMLLSRRCAVRAPEPGDGYGSGDGDED